MELDCLQFYDKHWCFKILINYSEKNCRAFFKFNRLAYYCEQTNVAGEIVNLDKNKNRNKKVVKCEENFRGPIRKSR